MVQTRIGVALGSASEVLTRKSCATGFDLYPIARAPSVA